MNDENVKLCRRCVKYLPLEMFGINKAVRSGRQSWCKPCTRERFLERYHADPEMFRMRQRGYYARRRELDPDHAKRQGKQWRADNRDKALAYEQKRKHDPARQEWYRQWSERRKAEKAERETEQ